MNTLAVAQWWDRDRGMSAAVRASILRQRHYAAVIAASPTALLHTQPQIPSPLEALIEALTSLANQLLEMVVQHATLMSKANALRDFIYVVYDLLLQLWQLL